MKPPPYDEPSGSDGVIMLLGVGLALLLAGFGLWFLGGNLTDPVDPGVPPPTSYLNQ